MVPLARSSSCERSSLLRASICDSIPEINRRIDSIVAKGRNPVPRHVKLTTYTLRYNQMFWVTVDGLGQHWEKATVEAEIKDATTVSVKTSNVSAFTLAMPAGLCPLNAATKPTVMIDGQKLAATAVQSDRSWTAHFRKTGKIWAVVASVEDQVFYFSPVNPPAVAVSAIPTPPGGTGVPPGLTGVSPRITDAGIALSINGSQLAFGRAADRMNVRKKHGLQGPIDDAFMDRFIFVRPTGKASNEAVNTWVTAEMKRAITQWRALFRGEAIVKNDDEITAADIASSHLILWGDAASNKLLTKIAAQLPIQWTAEKIQVGTQSYASVNHIPVLIYPNPLNANRYVVLNSGFTFREADHLSNARQNPKLPDWAIVDITTPPSPRSVGKVVRAGFFGERWELK